MANKMSMISGGRQCESNVLYGSGDGKLQILQTAKTDKTANIERIPYSGVQRAELAEMWRRWMMHRPDFTECSKRPKV